MGEPRIKIELQLAEDDAWALAQLCKRAFLERVLPFAASDSEAEDMLVALNELGHALATSGVAPR